MNIERKDIDEVNLELTMLVEKADYAESVDKSLKEYRKKANMPGYRPGHVPFNLIQKMYGKAVKMEEIQRVVSDSLFKYIQDNKLAVLGDPLPSEKSEAPNLDNDEPKKFIFDVAVAPAFDITLGKDTVLTQYDIEVDDKMLADGIKQYTSRFGEYVDAETTEENDLLRGSVVELENGQVKENGIKNESAILGPKYVKDEETKKKFLGIARGAEVVFNPKVAMDSDVETASFLKIEKDKVGEADKDFRFTLNDIQRFKEAELNQDFFDKVLGPGKAHSEDEFKTLLKGDLKNSLVIDSDFKLLDDARGALTQKLDGLKFPEDFLKRWLKVSNREKLTDEQIEKDFPGMLKTLKWQLVKNQIAEKNGLKIEENDLVEFAKKVARAQFAQYGMLAVSDETVENYARSMMKEKDFVKNVSDRVIDEKVLAIVKQSVKLNTKAVSFDEFNSLVQQD